MAVSTTSVQGSTVPGNEVFTVSEVTFDSSYAEGGEALTASELGLKKVSFAIPVLKMGAEAAEKWICQAWYTPSDEKIHLLDAKTGKELAKETNTEKVKAFVVAFGLLK